MADLLRFQTGRFGRLLARDCGPPEQFSEAIKFAPTSPGSVKCHYMRVG